MTNPEARLLFADSNVFVEDLFIKDSAASVIMNMVAAGCSQVWYPNAVM